MLPLRAVALLFLCASPALSAHPRRSRSAGFHHQSSYGSSFASGFGSQGLASEPVVQTHASYKGCSSATGCAGITLENGKITEKFGNPAAIGLHGGEIPDNIDPAELHKKFALQAADINSAFASNLPVNGPFWWATKDSPFKDTYETYLKWVKENSFGTPPFTSPCGTSTCPFGSSFSSQNKVSAVGGAGSNAIDISNNPFLNGQFAASGFTGGAAGSSGFSTGAAGVDISKNPFLSGNVHLAGGQHQGGAAQSGSSSSFSSFGSSTGGAGINIAGNPFLNGAISSSGCGAGKSGCSQSNSLTFQSGSIAKPGSFDILNLDKNPFLNGQISQPTGGASYQISGSSTIGGGCGGAGGSCGGNKQVVNGFQQQQVTTGFGGNNFQGQEQVSTGFPSGCGGAGCGSQQGGQGQITTGFTQQQITTGFNKPGCSGVGCGQQQPIPSGFDQGKQGQQQGQITTGFTQQQTTTGFNKPGCSGVGCGQQQPIPSGFDQGKRGQQQGQITTGFTQQQTTTGFNKPGCSGVGCGQQQPIPSGFDQGKQGQQQGQITTSFSQNKPGCSGAGCNQGGQQQITTGFQQVQTGCSGAFCGQGQQTQQPFPKPTASGCSGPFCGQDQQTQQGFPQQPSLPKKSPASNLPHPPGTAGQGFKESGNVNSELTVTCVGEGNICVKKYLCVNGFVNENGENILQARSGIRCPVSTESCCKIKPKGPQTTSQTFTGSYQSTAGQKIQSSSQITTGPGLIHVAGVPGEKAFGQQQNYNEYNQNTGKPANEVRPPFTSPGDTGIYQDSVISQSQQQQYTRPNFGNAKNPGTPYLPPVDEKYKAYEYPEPKNPYNPEPTPTVYKPTPTVYKPTPTVYKPIPTLPAPKPTPVAPPKPTPYVPVPTQYKPQPTPYQPQPTPYQPQPTQKVTPTPYKPQPTPYRPQPTQKVTPTPNKPQPTPPKPTGPGYLPPVDVEDPRSSIGSQQIVPRPGDSEGGIILDETRTIRPKVPQTPFIPIIPSGCAAALKCTPKEFCSADGIISNATVRLTQEQEDFRVPLTDCKEPSTGVVGKCCRDPNYTDPWPTNQLGQWIPGAFGDTGAYKDSQNRGQPSRGPIAGQRNPNNNQRPFNNNNNGFGLNPAGSINNPIYAENPNAIGQIKTPVNPGAYQTQPNQNNPRNPGVFPTGSIGTPGKQTFPLNPVTNPNFPTGPAVSTGFPDSPLSLVNTEEIYPEGELLLGNYKNAKKPNQNQGSCGVRKGTKPLGNKDLFEADFGEIPWQAMVLLQTNRTLLCGGVITSENIVVTSAHCIDGLDAKNVLIKGGEWKLGVDEEPKPFQIVQVAKIHKHPQYYSGSLQNDFAVLVLSEKLRYAPNIAPVCLPPLNQNANQRLYQSGGRYKCITTGWGKQVLQVNIPNSILHTVDMNLIPPTQCQAQIQQNYPHLLENYNANTCICGQPAQQSASVCKVDIGSALACTNGDGTYYMEGVYSWDAGCSSSNQLAAFYKFDSFWYQSVSEGGNYQANLYEQSQISDGGALNAGLLQNQGSLQQQQGGYSTQVKQTVTKHGQSYVIGGQKQFEQAIGGHIHTGPQCQCFEDGKK